MDKKTHAVTMVLGYCFKTPCGRFLDGLDKERGEANPHKVTCGNCRRTHVFQVQKRMSRRLL
jgi:hypothetical protein